MEGDGEQVRERSVALRFGRAEMETRPEVAEPYWHRHNRGTLHHTATGSSSTPIVLHSAQTCKSTQRSGVDIHRLHMRNHPCLSSTHFLTALLDSASIQLLLHLSSCGLRPPPPPLCRSVWAGGKPQSSQSFMTVPQQDQISSYVTSKRMYQSLGRGMRLRRVVRRIEAQARVWAG